MKKIIVMLAFVLMSHSSLGAENPEKDASRTIRLVQSTLNWGYKKYGESIFPGVGRTLKEMSEETEQLRQYTKQYTDKQWNKLATLCKDSPVTRYAAVGLGLASDAVFSYHACNLLFSRMFSSPSALGYISRMGLSKEFVVKTASYSLAGVMSLAGMEKSYEDPLNTLWRAGKQRIFLAAIHTKMIMDLYNTPGAAEALIYVASSYFGRLF